MTRSTSILIRSGVAAVACGLALVAAAFFLTGMGAASAATAVVGVVVLVSGAIVACVPLWRRMRRQHPVGAVLAVAGVVLGGLVLLVSSYPIMILAGGLCLAAVAVLPASIGMRESSHPHRGRAIVAVTVGALGAFGVLAAGLWHVYVANPQAKVPDLTLDEIYRAMSDAGELPSPVVAVVWAVLVAIAALLPLAVIASPRRARSPLGHERLLASYGLALGGAVAVQTVWFLGFGMGMGIADTFATSGGDATGIGTVISIVGCALFIAAALVGVLPVRPASPDADDVNAPSAPHAGAERSVV